MILNRIFRILILLVGIFWIWSCSSAYYLEHHPNLTENILYNRVTHAEKKLNHRPANPELLLKACKLRTEYTYAFTMEEADRLIESDYHKGKERYNKALTSFELAMDNGKKALMILYPDLTSLTRETIKNHRFKQDDIPYLYWLAAAYGGAISSSRGKAKWIIQLPIVGDLLEAALQVDESWQQGAIHNALITYSMVRTDIGGKNVEEATMHYKKSMEFSESKDLSAQVSYAENVLVFLQKKTEFNFIINEVIKQDISASNDLELGNIVAQNRAQWLLSRKDELFY